MLASMRVAVALAIATLAMVQADNVEVKVATFNVRTSQASEDAHHQCSNWAGSRKGNVVAQFHSINADFVGTQETSDDQRGYLDDVLKDTYKSIGTRSGSLHGSASEVNTIHYKFNDWKMIGEKTYWFGPNTDAPSAAWGMEYFRTVVYGRFQHIKSGITVCIANTHYETPGKDLAQTEASKIIIAKTSAFCQAGDKLTALTGDFNAQPNYQAMKTLFADNWIEKSDETTFCGNMHSPTCQVKFDFTLFKLGGGDDVCHKKSEVVRQAFGSCYPSDHAVVASTFCISGSCCGTETPSPSPSPSPPPSPSPSPDAANQTSSTTGSLPSFDFSSTGGSSENESDVQPGVVIPQGEPVIFSGGGDGAARDAAGGDAAGGDAAAAPAGEAEAVTQINNKSATTTDATGTVFAIMGVIAAVGAVCAFVIKKKRALEAQLDDQKSGLAPIPSFFSRAENDALSPRRTTKAMARKFSSPVPTLETVMDNRHRSFSQTSSIPCDDRRSSVAQSDRYDDSMSRMSSPVLLDDDGRETGRGSSRLYFSEVVTERTVQKNPRNDFALL